jgi:hypothetical protein
MNESPRALLLVMMDIDPEHEEDFNRWYSEEHVPERLSVPGFVSARRFRAVEGSPRYLALYELDSPDVLQSDAYRHFLEGEGETQWTRRVLAACRTQTALLRKSGLWSLCALLVVKCGRILLPRAHKLSQNRFPSQRAPKSGRMRGRVKNFVRNVYVEILNEG